MKEKVFNIVLGSIIMVLLGLVLYLFYTRSTTEPVIIEPDTKKEQATIDSLKNVVQVYEDSIIYLQNNVRYIKEVVVVEKIREIQSLPVDSNVRLLKDNLVAYGELTQPRDTLPKLASVGPGNDTTVLISEENVKDMNTIVAKYEGEVEINSNLEEIIEKDKVLIQCKDSIILEKDVILDKNLVAFEKNMKAMEKSIKKEKVKSGVVGGVLGTIVLVLTGVLISK